MDPGPPGTTFHLAAAVWAPGVVGRAERPRPTAPLPTERRRPRSSRPKLATLRRELPARVELVAAGYQRAIDLALLPR
ncbi:hypothetical protein LT493_26390 [Streptomyces tricolor]|nr:hypothetical protein [Streptomyces tricolor]